MTASGTVREWHDGEGWGVVDSADTPGGCWTHYSAVAVAGYRTLAPGQEVRLDFEQADEGGFGFVARAVWPADRAPVHEEPAPPGAAYSSELTLTVDHEDGDEDP